jgi:hypothetical protein
MNENGIKSATNVMKAEAHGKPVRIRIPKQQYPEREKEKKNTKRRRGKGNEIDEEKGSD